MERDRAQLRQLVATFYAFELVQLLLRLVSLGRVDAFGFPAVNKFDWYIFHAIAFDWLWYLPLALLMGVPWLLKSDSEGRLARGWRRGFRTLFALLLLLTVIDQELFRFMSMHFSRSMMQTYGNAASIRETIGMLGADQSIPWLPVLLLFGVVPLFWVLERLLSKKIARLRPHAVVWGVLTVVFWSYTQWIWGGGFREARLAPAIKVLLFAEGDRQTELLDEERLRLVEQYRSEWLDAQGDSLWVFGEPDFPFLRMTRQQRCAVEPSPRCDEDGDGDGVPLRDDPNDWNSEITGGENREKINFVIAILESHRAVNSGLFYGRGSWEKGTPLLDSLAGEGMVWSRFNAGGVPTIGALASIHLGIHEYPHRHIISTMTQLRALSFLEPLREAGYQSHFFSSADPVWDNQVPWLNRWYDRWHYHRSLEEDKAMFVHAASWSVDSLDRTRPFVITLMSKTNHYPFNWVEGMEPYPDTLSLQGRMLQTMRYTEEGLSEAIRTLDSAGLMHQTVLIVLADHGFSLGLRPEEHQSGQIGNGLFSEHTWVPLVMVGDHPLILKGERRDEPASQIDLAPTILELAGLAPTNSWKGHSLLRPSGQSRAQALLFRNTEGVIERGGWRVHGGWSGEGRELGDAIYDGISDRNELRDLSASHRSERDSLLVLLRNQARLHAWAIEQNRVWPHAPAFEAKR